MLVKSQYYVIAPLAFLLGGLTYLHLIPAITALLIFIFATLLASYNYFLSTSNPKGFYVSWLLAIVTGVVVGSYRPSGFSYPLVLKVNQLYEGGLPFELYLNIAKMIAGYLILLLIFSSSFRNTKKISSTGHGLIVRGLIACGLAALVLIAAYFVLDLQVHIKAINYILIFALVNLFITCVAEEAFMRLLLQSQLQYFFARKNMRRLWLETFSLIIVTLVFVLTHFTPSVDMLLIYTLAGFVYGLAYSLTKSLWIAIAVHFLVNIIHFAFFTYPLS